MQESQNVNTQVTQNSPMAEMTINASDLPSRGLGYPAGQKFYYKSYTFGEIKQASTTNDMGITQIIETVISGIRADNFDIKDMSFVDMLYIGLLRRVSSQGNVKYQMPYICESCDKQSMALFGSGDIDFQDIKEEVTSLPLEVDINGTTFQFMYPTVRNMLDIQANKKKKRNNPAMEITAASVINMDFKTALERLSNITDPDDMETLAEIDSLLFHDIKPVKAICNNKIEKDDGTEVPCKHENEVSIEGKELLVKPFRDGERPNRNKIRFINKQNS